jgi:hypothetical protein
MKTIDLPQVTDRENYRPAIKSFVVEITDLLQVTNP